MKKKNVKHNQYICIRVPPVIGLVKKYYNDIRRQKSGRQRKNATKNIILNAVNLNMYTDNSYNIIPTSFLLFTLFILYYILYESPISKL